MPESDPITEHEDFFQHTHRLMAGLRAASPVRRVRLGLGEEGWLITRYEDAKAASSAAEARRDYGTLLRLHRAQPELWDLVNYDPESVFAWLYREDYARGGIRMLPVVEPDGRSTARRILFYSLGLIPISLLPSFLGMAGRIYAIGAFLLGVGPGNFSRAFLSLPSSVSIDRFKAVDPVLAFDIYLGKTPAPARASRLGPPHAVPVFTRTVRRSHADHRSVAARRARRIALQH